MLDLFAFIDGDCVPFLLGDGDRVAAFFGDGDCVPLGFALIEGGSDDVRFGLVGDIVGAFVDTQPFWFLFRT